MRSLLPTLNRKEPDRLATRTSPDTLRNGPSSLLRPEDSVLVLIDHQPYQLANLNSHDPHMAVNNATGLAKAAKALGIPTILTGVVEDRGGRIFPQITTLCSSRSPGSPSTSRLWDTGHFS